MFNFIFTLICITWALFGVFILFRSSWVHKKRMEILDTKPYIKSLEEYSKLPSYDYMLYHFWIWDVEKFKR